MSDVLVSFVVPAYNEEALIGSCLTAITAEVSRTGCQAEIIVVDNGSSDGTRRIALAMPGVKVVDEPQRGLVQARRAGCLAAEGEYIANIDADTVLAEGGCETALAEFAHSADLVALSGPYIHYDLPTPARLVAAGFYRGVYIVHLLSRVVAGAGSVMQGGNFIVSRSALERAGGFNPIFDFTARTPSWRAVWLRSERSNSPSLCRPSLQAGDFAGEGLFRVLLRYSANYLWTHLFKRPFSADWLDFRHVAGATTAIGSASTIVQLDLQRTEVLPDLAPGTPALVTGLEMPGHYLIILIAIPGSWLLAGRQAAAAPTIPLPEPGAEFGMLPALAILGIIAAVAMAELIHPQRRRSDVASRRWVGNLSLCLASNGILVLPALTPLAAAFLSEFAQSGLLDLLRAAGEMRVVIAIVGLDALAYAQHRVLHRVDVLWRFHLVHHSDPEIDRNHHVSASSRRGDLQRCGGRRRRSGDRVLAG